MDNKKKDFDFISFSYGNVSSSTLGIIRTSDGSRYNYNLLPTFQDKTAKVEGQNGTYYWDSEYTQRPIDIPIAFDHMTEKQMRQLQELLGAQEIKELIFSETPYKVYMAKPTGMPQLKYICFNENNQRIYKGEGTLNFICYFPFAKSKYKFIQEYEQFLKENRPENGWEWEESEQIDVQKIDTGWEYKEVQTPKREEIENYYIKNEKGEYEKAKEFVEGTRYYVKVRKCYLYDNSFDFFLKGRKGFRIKNLGIKRNPFQIFIPFFKTISNSSSEGNSLSTNTGGSNNQTGKGGTEPKTKSSVIPLEFISLKKGVTSSAEELQKITFLKPIEKKNNDIGICLDFKTKLINGIAPDGAVSNQLYNEYIDRENFFLIPSNITDYLLYISFSENPSKKVEKTKDKRWSYTKQYYFDIEGLQRVFVKPNPKQLSLYEHIEDTYKLTEDEVWNYEKNYFIYSNHLYEGIIEPIPSVLGLYEDTNLPQLKYDYLYY